MVVSKRLPCKSTCTSPTRLKNLSGHAEVTGTDRYCLTIRVKSGNSCWCFFHHIRGFVSLGTCWTCMYDWRWTSPSGFDRGHVEIHGCGTHTQEFVQIDTTIACTRLVVGCLSLPSVSQQLRQSSCVLDHSRIRHPRSNSRLLFLVHRLFFTTSTKYYGLCRSIEDCLSLSLKYIHTGEYQSWFRTCGVLTHTLSTRGLTRLTQRFHTRIIRDSPSPFDIDTLSRIRFCITLHHFCSFMRDGFF
jgi:hypothetical protein